MEPFNWIDAFSWCLALGPIAIYLLLIGAINVSRRPFLVSGSRDMAALGLAIAGLVMVGPLQLFYPVAAAMRYGGFIWAFLIGLYLMVLVLVLLLVRPRLVLYNVTVEELRPVLSSVVTHLDGEARWAGDGVVLPNLRVQLHLDSVRILRNVTLVSSGPEQSHLGWRRLELALTAALGQVQVRRRPLAPAIGLLTAGVLIAILLTFLIARDPQAVAQSLVQMLR
jgi:hypothetical protein